MVGAWGDPFYLKTGPVGAKSPIFSRYSFVTPKTSEKVQLTLIGSPLLAFQ